MKSMISSLLLVLCFSAPQFASEAPLDITPPPDGVRPMKMDKPDMIMHRVPPPELLNTMELPELLDELGVKKEIADKIVIISRTFMRSLEERMIRVQREELNVKEELLKDKPNLNTIQSIVNKKSQIISDIEFLQIKRDLEIKSLLTDQEYEKWKAILIKRVHRPMPFHGKMKDRPIEHRP